MFCDEQNDPNPCNSGTTIGCKIPASSAGRQGSGFTSLKVYDLLGREVRTLVHENLQAESYEVTFDATGLASGTYFYRLSVVPLARRDLVPTGSRGGQVGELVQTRKLLLLR